MYIPAGIEEKWEEIKKGTGGNLLYIFHFEEKKNNVNVAESGN